MNFVLPQQTALVDNNINVKNDLINKMFTKVIEEKEIKPELKPAEFPIFICPFCQAEWDFVMADTFETMIITFHCPKCMRDFKVTRSPYNSI